MGWFPILGSIFNGYRQSAFGFVLSCLVILVLRDFRKYKVWEQSHLLTLEVYRITKTFPIDERYGIISQIRRACSSIPTNIAEGCGKSSEKDFARFLGISYGSASETEYLILLSKDLNYIDLILHQKIHEELVSIKKQLFQLIKKLNENQ